MLLVQLDLESTGKALLAFFQEENSSKHLEVTDSLFFIFIFVFFLPAPIENAAKCHTEEKIPSFRTHKPHAQVD